MDEPRPRKKLREMAAEAAQRSDGSIVCPACGCADFRTLNKDRQSGTSSYRYKSCRNCGRHVYTKTTQTERIIRVVRGYEIDDEDDENQ